MAPKCRRGGNDRLTVDDLARSLFETGYPPLLLGNGKVLTRDLAIAYATMFRCVSLVSGTVAELLSTSAHVRDYDGTEIKSRHARAVLDLLRESPDGEIAAMSWLEDYVSDYCLDGNAISVLERGVGDMIPRRMWLADPWSARAWRPASSSPMVYHVRRDPGDAYEMAAPVNVPHARWPRMAGRYAVERNRGRFFARPPIQTLGGALNIGLETDKWVRQFFDVDNGGVRSNLAIVHNDWPDEKTQKGIRKALVRFARSRLPLLLFGGANVENFGTSPQDADALKLREFQVREIGRMFGVPAPLLGENVTQWGQGIEQLARLFWRFGLRHHLGRCNAALSFRMLPRGQRIAVDETQLLRGDTAAIARLMAAGLGDGQRPAVLTRREFRRLLGFDPEIDMDEVLAMRDEIGVPTMGDPPGPPGEGPDPDDPEGGEGGENGGEPGEGGGIPG